MRFCIYTFFILTTFFIASCASDNTDDIAQTTTQETQQKAKKLPKKPLVLLDSQKLLGKKPVVKRIDELEMSQPKVIIKKKPRKKQIAEIDPQKETISESKKMRVIKNETQPTIKAKKRPVAKTETTLVQNNVTEKPVEKVVKKVTEKPVEKVEDVKINISDFSITQPTIKQSRSTVFTDAIVYKDMVEYYFTDKQKRVVKIRIDNEPKEGAVIPTMPDNLLTTKESGNGKMPNPIKIGKSYMITYDSKGNPKTVMDLSQTSIKTN